MLIVLLYSQVYLCKCKAIGISHISWSRIERGDAILSRDGWPTEVPVELQSYLKKREEMGMESNGLFRRTCIVIPASCGRKYCPSCINSTKK